MSLDNEWMNKIPPDVIVNGVVHVVSYIQADNGEMEYSVWWEGDLILSSILGLLELAKLDLVNRQD